MSTALLRWSLVLTVLLTFQVTTTARENGPKAGLETASGFVIGESWTLPGELERVKDVRWVGEDSIYVARSGEGTARLSLVPERTPEVSGTPLPGGHGARPRVHSMLGYSQGQLVVAAPFFEIVLDDAEGDPRYGPVFEGIEDVDIDHGRLAVLASRRDDEGIPEPTIAWLIDVDDDAKERSLVRSVDSREGPWPIDSCASYDMGAVRFLPDGNLVVVPGVEPDVYLFSSEGRLLRTWPTEPLDLADDCDMSRKQVEHLALVEEERWKWLNRRRTVDEIVPLPGGDVGLIVRDATAGPGVRWSLVRLREDGGHSVHSLPFDSPTDRAFLRADVRAGKAVVLIGQWWSKDTDVDVAPRLITGRFVPPEAAPDRPQAP